jgi:uncharacterized protein YecT (DUF1311 family)
VGYAVIRFAFLLAASMACAPAMAQDKPDAKDAAAIEKCMTAKTGRNWAWERCIGTISEPCVKKHPRQVPSDVMACYAREQAVWDDILNGSYKILMKALEQDQQVKLREMQRAWIVLRDKTCGFLYDYFQGSMANPMMAACESRATGMQALYLRGFADDVADRK